MRRGRGHEHHAHAERYTCAIVKLLRSLVKTSRRPISRIIHGSCVSIEIAGRALMSALHTHLSRSLVIDAQTCIATVIVAFASDDYTVRPQNTCAMLSCKKLVGVLTIKTHTRTSQTCKSSLTKSRHRDSYAMLRHRCSYAKSYTSVRKRGKSIRQRVHHSKKNSTKKTIHSYRLLAT